MLGDLFAVVPFDTHAAIYAADLLPDVKKRKKNVNARQYKVDVMIFASALSRGAHKFLFADGDFVGMSEGQSIKMVDVTKLHVQTVLPPPA